MLSQTDLLNNNTFHSGLEINEMNPSITRAWAHNLE